MKKSRYTGLIKIVVIIAMIVNVLMFVVNAMQVKAAHVDLDADQMHYSIRLCVKNVVSLLIQQDISYSVNILAKINKTKWRTRSNKQVFR